MHEICGTLAAMHTLLAGHLTRDSCQGSLPAAGTALRPKRVLAQQMARGKQSEGVNLEEFDMACISMFDPSTWPQTRRDETFVTQANKLWTFLTEVMVRSSMRWTAPACMTKALQQSQLEQPGQRLCASMVAMPALINPWTT